jgi:hypothetical protein
MGSGELRYWSYCSNQGFANTRVNDCVFDEQLPLDKNGYFTLVISRPEDRYAASEWQHNTLGFI